MPFLLPLVVAAALPSDPIVPPPGLSAQYLGLFDAVKAAPPSRAARLAKMLPKPSPILRWDPSGLPAALRPRFREALDYALAQWRVSLPEFRPRLLVGKGPADILVNFAPNVARGAGATFFFSKATDEPRLEAVVALARRGGKTTSTDFHNEVAYAIGSYLGLAPAISFYGAMGRTDLRSPVLVEVNGGEAALARRTLSISAEVRSRLGKGIALGGGTPSLWTERRELAIPEVEQGATPEVTVQVANRGTAPLTLAVAGDCGCLAASGPSFLGPNETGVIRARYETSVMQGDSARTVLVRTNDPEAPLIRIPVKVRVRPVVRLVRNGGLLQVVRGDEPFEALLLVEGDRNLPLDRARVASGFPIAATFEPWRGTFADPLFGGESRPERGFLMRAKPTGVPFGKFVVSVEIPTNDPALGVQRFNYTVQRGIVAEPANAFFDELGPETEPVTLTLTRPGSPFRVRSVSSPHPAVAAKSVPTLDGAARVTISVDRTRVRGPLETEVIVMTDDPDQPRIAIPVLANLR